MTSSQNYSLNYDHNSTALEEKEEEVIRRQIYIIQCIVLPIICGVGIIFNALNLFVLLQKGLNNSFYTYLTTLAIADLLLVTITLLSNEVVTPLFYGTLFYHVFDIYVSNWIWWSIFESSVLIVVSMSLERLLFIIRPLTTYSSRKKVYTTCGIILGLCLFTNSYICVQLKIVKTGASYTAVNSGILSTTFVNIIAPFKVLIVNVIAPVVLIVINTILVCVLFRTAKCRAALQSSRETSVKDQMRFVLTLIGVSVVFFICATLPAYIVGFLQISIVKGHQINQLKLEKWVEIAGVLVHVNSSVNFIVYLAINPKYRKVAINVLLRRQVNEDGTSLHFTHSMRTATFTRGQTLRTGSSITRPNSSTV